MSNIVCTVWYTKSIISLNYLYFSNIDFNYNTLKLTIIHAIFDIIFLACTMHYLYKSSVIVIDFLFSTLNREIITDFNPIIYQHYFDAY